MTDHLAVVIDDTPADEVTAPPVPEPRQVYPPISRGELLTLRETARALRMSPARVRRLLAPGGRLHDAIFDPDGRWEDPDGPMPHGVRIAARHVTRLVNEGATT